MSSSDTVGLDIDYIQSFSTIFRFLCDRYWRIETKGLEHIPVRGPAVLVGTHRGFVPWDAIMTLYIVARSWNRYIRFLVHPGLLRFSLIANFIRRLGGVIACRESAASVLESGELLGVFPEGVQGAFTVYRRAYQLQNFGRHGFVKMALQSGVPVIPFVNVGSAEALPIFARIRSRRWTRFSDWPYLPISTFPFIPVPLPSKWHIEFLPPVSLDLARHPERAVEASVVKAISVDVRRRMQEAIDEILRRRPSIFAGSVFTPTPPPH